MTPLESFKNVIAKTDPEHTLYEHTQNVIDEASAILDVLGYEAKYARLTGYSLRKRLLRAALYHDWGKMHDWWRKHRRQGTLQKAQLRHEMVSVQYARKKRKRLFPEEEVAILAHHGKLGHYHKHRWHGDRVNFEGMWAELRELQRHIAPTTGASFEEVLRARYAFNCVRSLLRLADQRASQRERHGPDPLPLHSFHYDFQYDPWEVQKKAKALGDQMVAALRAETGAGKTHAALHWAERHIDAGRARRVIMALPTRFTATSLAEDISEHVRTGLYHSSAWYELEDEDRAGEILQTARRFLDPVTVTTIDQVLMALTGRSEEHHLRFTNLAHSALVIDEIDAYSEELQANLQVLVDALRVLDVPVFMMSATVPTSHLLAFARDEESTPTGSESAEEDGSIAFIDTTDAGSSFDLRAMEELEDPHKLPPSWIRDRERVIVYANTVDRAVAYYEAISTMRDGDDVVLYHSRFTQPDRAKKEKQILEMLGEKGRGGVAVMTQVGEMSLNISAAVMISELAPIDRVAQRTGRMGRFPLSDETLPHGELRIIVPVQNDSLYPAPYGTYNMAARSWTPADALLQTREKLQVGASYDKVQLRDLAEEVYSDGLQIGPRAEENAKRYVEAEITENWLIVPRYSAPAEETDTDEWSTRFIPPQVPVFIGEPEDIYEEEHDYRRAELLQSVSIYAYKARDLPTKVVTINDEPRTITYSEDYDMELGLRV